MLAYAVVYSFVVPAEDNNILKAGEPVCRSLAEALSIGRHIDYLIIFPLCLKFGDNGIYWLYAHYHTGVSAVGIVIYVTEGPKAIFSKVVHHYLYKALLLCSLYD